jgi:hypothetical protein
MSLFILHHGKSRTFDPFDRPGFQDLIRGKTIEVLVGEFGQLRKENLEILKSFSLDERKLNLPSVHPELGEVTMRQFLATWTLHDLGHIAQIMRIMAVQYRSEVGPWVEYASILNDSKAALARE